MGAGIEVNRRLGQFANAGKGDSSREGNKAQHTHDRVKREEPSSPEGTIYAMHCSLLL